MPIFKTPIRAPILKLPILRAPQINGFLKIFLRNTKNNKLNQPALKPCFSTFSTLLLRNLSLIFSLILVQLFGVNCALAQLNGSSDIVREIEKNLLFDKESQEKFDVYNNKYDSNLSKKSSSGATLQAGEKVEYPAEDMKIILLDKTKIDKDLREKEKLAYNSALIGQYEVALELYKEILKKEPNNMGVKYSIALLYQNLNQFKQAKNIYQELLKAGVDNKDEIINNVLAILVEESPREAIYTISKFIAQTPETPYLYANLGLAYEKISDNNSAISNYAKAYQLDKNNPNYCYNLGVLYDRNKDYARAIEMYNLVIKNSNNSNSNITLDSVRNRLENIKNLI